MSLTGIASSVLSLLNGYQNGTPAQSSSHSFSSEFSQLGQALQTGNLSQAQQDFATLTQNFPGVTQSSTANSTANAVSATASTNTNPLTQAITQLGNDLQSGNLSAAQSDFTTVQQDLQQISGQGGQIRGHGHHHHHSEGSQTSSSSAQTSQTNSITQEFSQLAQSLQGGNLQGAQSAFSLLQSDLQQIGGFSPASTPGATGASSGGINVNV